MPMVKRNDRRFRVEENRRWMKVDKRAGAIQSMTVEDTKDIASMPRK